MEGNFINAKVVMPPSHAQELDPGRKRPSRPLTFEIVCDWIRLQGFDEYTTNGLIDLAAKVPTSALSHFRRNFNLMLARVRQQRQKEQQGFQQDENQP